MTTDCGRSGADAPSSSRPTDGAASVSTADAASIPNAMEERLSELLALEFNWNSYRALPIDPACAERVRRFYPVMETLGLQPWITPENDGGLMIERGGEDDYSVEFHPNGTVSVYFEGLSDTDAWGLVGLFAQFKALDAIAMEARQGGDALSEGPLRTIRRRKGAAPSSDDSAGRNGIAPDTSHD